MILKVTLKQFMKRLSQSVPRKAFLPSGMLRACVRCSREKHTDVSHAGFQANARAGCMLISNSFAIDGVEPDEVLPLDGHLQKALLIWRKK